MCGETGETISHIESECSKLAQSEYKRRHDNVARMVHWKLCKKFNLEKSEKWYLRNPQTVTENVNRKLIWGANIQCDNVIAEGKPDIVIDNRIRKRAIITDVVIPGDKRIIDTEKEKTEKIDVIPVVLGGLGSVTKTFEKYVDNIGIKIDLHTVKKPTLLGTARILRTVLEC